MKLEFEPSKLITAPERYFISFSIMDATKLPISWGSPNLFIGKLSAYSPTSLTNSFVLSVLIGPGAILIIVMSLDANSLLKILNTLEKAALYALDIINFKLFQSNKVEKRLIKLIEVYEDKISPTMPIGANVLMSKYNIPEGKILGNKLKMIEEMWVQNGFQISDKQIQKIILG